MKLSLNFVKDYITLEENLKQIAEDMTKAGNEYDSAEKLIPATKLVVGQVKECKLHPDSDHLHVCMVDIGTQMLHIVCGAPNVREGLKVIVAQVGAELSGGVKINKGKIRGEDSEGMLCSIAELGLEHKFLTDADKDGICELPQEAKIGEDPIAVLGLDDEVIDFDLTANRGDLLSILGMAYELGAIYDKKVKDMPVTYTPNQEDIKDTFKVEVNTENCSIFLAKKVKNVTIKESPTFIKNRLIASGIRPINNVVDISNYVMLETGQPLHFYDADSLQGKIEVRMAKQNETLTTLDGIDRELCQEDIVITDGKQAIGLAGVMGGLHTEITPNTKNIIIEAAIFNPVLVRYTSKKIVRSEASSRFEKGLDANRTYLAQERACYLLEKYADAEVVGGMVTYDTTTKEDKEIAITYDHINKILGSAISKKDIQEVFRRLAFTYEEKDENTLLVKVPTRRIDISIKEDLIEEVGRIYGVDNIEGKLPSLPLKAGHFDKTTRQIRNKLISLGLNETLSYVLVGEKEAKEFITEPETKALRLMDPLTEERNTLRCSMLPSLFKIYEYNQARNVKDISIFEIGKSFFQRGENYGEENKVAVLMSGDYYYGIGNQKQVDFFVIKGVMEELLDFLGFNGRYSLVMPKELPEQFHPGQSADISINNDMVGRIGKVHPQKAKEDVFVMEMNLDKILEKKTAKMKYKEISKYPAVKKDLAMVVDKNLTNREIEMVIKKAAGNLLTDITLFDVYTGEHVEEGKKSMAYSLTFLAKDRTLTDDEINSMLEKIIQEVEKKLGASLRK